MAKQISTVRLGRKLSKARLKKAESGPPPVVLAAQATSFIRLEKTSELRQWERDLRQSYGINLSGLAGTASESCSGGCSDDCDVC